MFSISAEDSIFDSSLAPKDQPVASATSSPVQIKRFQQHHNADREKRHAKIRDAAKYIWKKGRKVFHVIHIEPIGNKAKVVSITRLSLPFSPISLAILQASPPALHQKVDDNKEDEDIGHDSVSSRFILELLVVQPRMVMKCKVYLATDRHSLSDYISTSSETESTFEVNRVSYFIFGSIRSRTSPAFSQPRKLQ
jgi:hypothetical protein